MVSSFRLQHRPQKCLWCTVPDTESSECDGSDNLAPSRSETRIGISSRGRHSFLPSSSLFQFKRHHRYSHRTSDFSHFQMSHPSLLQTPLLLRIPESLFLHIHSPFVPEFLATPCTNPKIPLTTATAPFSATLGSSPRRSKC